MPPTNSDKRMFEGLIFWYVYYHKLDKKGGGSNE